MARALRVPFTKHSTHPLLTHSILHPAPYALAAKPTLSVLANFRKLARARNRYTTNASFGSRPAGTLTATK